MPLPITAIYAAFLGLLVIALGSRIVWLRYTHRIGLGDGGNKQLARAIRAHGNLVEYAPMALILMAACELNGAPAVFLHAIGATLVVGRLLHAQGLSSSEGVSFGRACGTTVTWIVLLAGSLGALRFALIG